MAPSGPEMKDLCDGQVTVTSIAAVSACSFISRDLPISSSFVESFSINFIMGGSIASVEMAKDKVAPEMSRVEGMVLDDNIDAHTRNLVVVNHALGEIGFGKYQWKLFCTCGFGFLLDQVSQQPAIPVESASIDSSPRCYPWPWAWSFLR